MTNEQAVVLAVWRLTAGSGVADVEDVAMCVDGLAPGRFRWRRYPEQVNLQAVGKALRDAKGRNLLTGGSASGWRLTEQGAAEARAADSGAVASARPPLSARERSWRTAERARLLSESAFRKVRAGAAAEVTARELLTFFGLDEYVVGAGRQERLERLQRVFAEDRQVAPVVALLLERLTP